MNSIGVIGGGITGLVAAYRLKQSDTNVTVYESSDRVGGPIRTVTRDGYLSELGPNTLLESSIFVSALISDLSLANRCIYAGGQSRNRYIVRNGKPVPLPNSAVSFITTSLFSAQAKLGFLKEPFIGRAKSSEEESLAAFVCRRMGPEFLDYVVNPFVGGIFGGDAERLSAKYAFPKLFELEQEYGSILMGQIRSRKSMKTSPKIPKQRSKMFSFIEGLQVLIDSLENNLQKEIKLNAIVKRIEQTSVGWNLHYDDRGTHYIKSHSSLIFTIPAYRIAELVHNISGADFSPLKYLYYPPITSLALGFKRSNVNHPLDGFGMLLPKVEPFNILGTLFSSSLFSNRAPTDHVLLTSYIGGARSPELTLRSESEQTEIVMNDLRQLLGVSGEPTFVQRTQYQRAIPQYEVGYGKYLNILEEVEERAPGLFFGGNYRNGISVSDCIANACKIVEKVLRKQ